MRTVLAGVVAALLAGSSALAQSQLLFLAEDVPAGLDYDGPSVSTNTSQTGFINLSEPLIYYPYGPTNAEGVRTLDYSKYEGRLVERWEFDEPSLTWTFHLRKGVKSCAGNEFTADDVIYTFERAKSVSGKAPDRLVPVERWLYRWIHARRLQAGRRQKPRRCRRKGRRLYGQDQTVGARTGCS